jgi:hypothetical protein
VSHDFNCLAHVYILTTYVILQVKELTILINKHLFVFLITMPLSSFFSLSVVAFISPGIAGSRCQQYLLLAASATPRAAGRFNR